MRGSRQRYVVAVIAQGKVQESQLVQGYGKAKARAFGLLQWFVDAGKAFDRVVVVGPHGGRPEVVFECGLGQVPVKLDPSGLPVGRA